MWERRWHLCGCTRIHGEKEHYSTLPTTLQSWLQPLLPIFVHLVEKRLGESGFWRSSGGQGGYVAVGTFYRQKCARKWDSMTPELLPSILTKFHVYRIKFSCSLKNVSKLIGHPKMKLRTSNIRLCIVYSNWIFSNLLTKHQVLKRDPHWKSARKYKIIRRSPFYSLVTKKLISKSWKFANTGNNARSQIVIFPFILRMLSRGARRDWQMILLL